MAKIAEERIKQRMIEEVIREAETLALAQKGLPSGIETVMLRCWIAALKLSGAVPDRELFIATSRLAIAAMEMIFLHKTAN